MRMPISRSGGASLYVYVSSHDLMCRLMRYSEILEQADLLSRAL